MANVISFEDALKGSGEKPRSLLLANGFSIKYFHYGTLLDNAGLQNTDPLRRLFDEIKTKDFERVLRILKDAAAVSHAYEWKEQTQLLAADIAKLRDALVTAIRKTHPAHRDAIAGIIPSCVAYLEKFERIFTLNYDLLLNWVTLENGTFSDGFGLGKKSNGFIAPFKTDARCSVFNLHGGLHLFRGSGDTLEKRIDEGVLRGVTRAFRIAQPGVCVADRHVLETHDQPPKGEPITRLSSSDVVFHRLHAFSTEKTQRGATRLPARAVSERRWGPGPRTFKSELCSPTCRTSLPPTFRFPRACAIAVRRRRSTSRRPRRRSSYARFFPRSTPRNPSGSVSSFGPARALKTP